MEEGKGFEREVLDRLIKIEAKIESWDSSKAQIYENQRKIIQLEEKNDQQQKEIDELKDKNKWMNRTSWGAILTGAGSIIVSLIMK